MFLLHGPQSRAQGQGENAANYHNPEFDALFERMKNMPNGPARAGSSIAWSQIYRRDVPWIGGFHPKDFNLFHAWLSNVKPNIMARNNLKYLRVDAARRDGDAQNVESAGPVAARTDRVTAVRSWWCRQSRVIAAVNAWRRAGQGRVGAR